MLTTTVRDLAQLYIPESFLYFAPKVSLPELKGLVRQSMRLLFGLGLLGSLILGGFALRPSLFLEGDHPEGLTVLLLLSGVSTVVGFPASVFGNLFIVTNNHRKSAGISLVVTVIGSAGALLPAILGAPVAWIVVSQIGSVALRFAMSWHVYARLYPGVPVAPFPGGLRAQIGYVVPLAVSRFANLFNQRLDKFVVGLFFTAGLFAEFSVGSQELPLVSILPYTIASTMLPELVDRFEKGSTRLTGAREAVLLWHTGIRKATLVMLPVATFLLLSADPLMRVLYGSAYAGAALPFRIYSALLPLRVTGYGIMLMAFGETKMILRAQAIGMIFNVAASLVLLPTIGMVGAPLAAVLTQATMIVFMLYRIERVARVGLRGIFPWRHYGRVALAAVLAAAPLAAAWATGAARVHPAIYLGAGVPIYLALYLSVARFAGILEEEDRAFVRRWLRLEPLLRRPAA
jgi:O-antigen/teichoic acid export membrane protein